MAYETNVGLDTTFLTDIDLSANQFHFVTLGSDGFLDIAGAGVRAIGVQQDTPLGTATATVRSEVRYGGISKVVAGGSFNVGDLLTSDSTGRAVKYTGATVFTGTPYVVSGSQVLGIALQAGTTGVTSTILFSPSGLSA
jgi:hypothetical protein